jgi:hypothetical protein
MICSIKNVEHFTWLDNVKKFLNECGFAYIWNTQTFVDPNWLRLTIIRNLQDQFEQYWHSLLDNSFWKITVIYILKHLAYCSNTLVYRCFDVVAWKYTLIF